ncbi:MAG TPA: family 10 glycosylhydrolase, partial [Armatimonadota bacterium]|nr:family 10 glycosylhydrolase [Armatimonadota bacterium]
MKGVWVLACALLLWAVPGLGAYEIIIDNPEAQFIGTWTTSSLTATRYGDDYRYCYADPANGRTATYQPNIPVTSNGWEVYTWYPSGANRTTAAQFIIHSSAGDDYKTINQQENGGYWFYLGTYTMNAGTGNYVRITNLGTDGKLVMADAVRFYLPSAEPHPEFRAAWADTWHNGMNSASQITTMVNTLAGANYNVVIPEVRRCGDAYYDSAYEPRANDIIDPLPFDPLQDCIDKAHAAGMECHAWIVTYRIWRDDDTWELPPDHMWALHPDWVNTDWSGNILDGVNYNFDPGIPGVQDYVSKVVMDIVSKYDVDGINFDYIRYPNPQWGYNNITRQRFYDLYGYWPPTSTTDAHWGTWSDYRRQQVTDLVKKCYLEIIALKPNVKMSVCGTGRMGADPNTNYTQTGQYRDVLQNTKGWMEQHIIDIDMLMNYKRDHLSDQKADFRLWADWLGDIAAATGRHSVCGQAAYLNTIANSLIQMQYARDAGCQGGTTYSYMSTNMDGLPNGDFYDAVRTNLYPSPVVVPDMPWKGNPTTGIIFGTVTDASKPDNPIYQNWVYQATVQVTGPVTQSTSTDATGTYGFMDLPPGTYTVTCSKSGFTTRTYTTQTILAGDVLRDDFDLGTVSISSPSNVIYRTG